MYEKDEAAEKYSGVARYIQNASMQAGNILRRVRTPPLPHNAIKLFFGVEVNHYFSSLFRFLDMHLCSKKFLKGILSSNKFRVCFNYSSRSRIRLSSWPFYDVFK